jgi:hypothetical protein
MVIRGIEAYELSPDSYNGVVQFFHAHHIAKLLLNEFEGRDLNLKETQIINALIKAWTLENDKEKKTKYSIIIAKIISKKFTDIQDFFSLKEIDESAYVPEYDLDVDRKKVSGCVATIVE